MTEILWHSDPTVAVAEQMPIAIYTNDDGHVVIRQKGDVYDEDDQYVVVAPSNVPALVYAVLQSAGLSSLPPRPPPLRKRARDGELPLKGGAA